MNFFKGMNFLQVTANPKVKKFSFQNFEKKIATPGKNGQRKAGGGGHWDVDFSNYQ